MGSSDDDDFFLSDESDHDAFVESKTKSERSPKEPVKSKNSLSKLTTNKRIQLTDGDTECVPVKKQKMDGHHTSGVAIREISTVKSATQQSESQHKAPESYDKPPLHLASSSSGSFSKDITRGPDVTTEKEAKSLIVRYLLTQNRPYSAIQIYDNLHKRIQKPSIERCLSSLSEPGGSLLCKEYGKAKIYFPDQSKLASNITPDQMSKLDSEITDRKNSLITAQNKERMLRTKLAALLTEPTDEDLDSVVKETEMRVAIKEKRLADLSSSSVDPAAMGKAAKDFTSSRSVWINRRRMCMEAVEILADGMGKSTKSVMAEMGMETDEQLGEVLPPPITEVPSSVMGGTQKRR